MIPEPALIGRHHPLLTEFRRTFREGAGAAATEAAAPLLAIEGPRLLDEAIRSGLRLEKVLFSQTGYDQLAGKLLPQLSKHVQTSLTDDAAFNAAMDAGHPQGVAALVRWEVATAEAVCSSTTAAPLILATALQDPGNLGTLVRAADAFGATGVLALAGTVSPLHPKAVRASAGSLFHLPVAAKLSAADLIRLCQKHGIRLLAATAHGGTRGGGTAVDADFTQPTCLIIGQEAGGVPRELLRAADGSVTIPMVREIDSLNAGVAGAILLYEAARQRGR
ncbi:MAG TPA: RNA methyltransferase [Terriglobales bacterium]